MMITVRYRRPGKESRGWEQRLLADTEDMIVSSFVFRLQKPFLSDDEGDVLIESGYYGVLFELLDRWYNVVKIYDEDRELKGYYTDIRKPPVKTEVGYEALDLFLDVWVYPDNEYMVLDRDEFEDADIDESLRREAERAVERVTTMVRNDDYPPELVEKFDVTDEVLDNLQ